MLSFLKELLEDAHSIAKRDPAVKTILEVVFLYPGYHAVFAHRVSNFFYKKRRYFIARWISQIARFFTGIEIHPGAKIGKGLFIDHGMGVVIGETAVIGDYCTIYHDVTLGGTGKDVGKRHPTIGNHVLLSAGAKVLGPFYVGDNARIGSNAVVLNEVPKDTTVVGVPGKVVKKSCQSEKPSLDLDQINIRDPVMEEFCKLSARLKLLEQKILNTKEEQFARKINQEGFAGFKSFTIEPFESIHMRGSATQSKSNLK
jgi:serine O-acetyltransferase